MARVQFRVCSHTPYCRALIRRREWKYNSCILKEDDLALAGQNHFLGM